MPEVVTILGAGAMGSALSTPAADNGHDVRLWGTWLDDELLDAVRAGRPHPRTGVPVDQRVRTFRSTELADALRDADYVVLAVSSEGIVEVLSRAAPHLRPSAPGGGQLLGITTKGFVREPGGIVLLPDAVNRVLADVRPPVVAIGGPCKANEVAARRPTASVHAASDVSIAKRSRDLLGTAGYAAALSDDPIGVEVAAAMKNVYAIAIGICHGLGERGGEPFHDLQAATFAQAVTEMIRLAEALGGRADTVAGLAGVGDLEVTALSGRNRVYGTRLGRGEPAPEALRAMRDAGQTVEGVPAAGLAGELIKQVTAGDFPLLREILALLDGEGGDRADRLAAAVLPGS
ncbi:MAG: glycerol-3-phosphate dehydrogenase [Pseudonocardiaceae bacterium]|nr:glycerol-3-phosphate dehydrogenase [Pseudonocardiaceae bacterium]